MTWIKRKNNFGSGPARFAARNQEHRVLKGRSLSLACRAEGDPPIEYTWSRRGVPLSTSSAQDTKNRFIKCEVIIIGRCGNNFFTVCEMQPVCTEIHRKFVKLKGRYTNFLGSANSKSANPGAHSANPGAHSAITNLLFSTPFKSSAPFKPCCGKTT